MSLLRYMFDNEFVQRADIERLKGDQRLDRRRERRGRHDQRRRMEALEDEVEELEIVTKALVQILLDQGTIEGAQVRERMAAVGEQLEAEERAEAEAEKQAQRDQAPTRKRRRP